MTDKPVVIQQDEGLIPESIGQSTIMNAKDNALFAVTQTDVSSQCGPIEIVDDRPTQISFNPKYPGDSSYVVDEIKYVGTSYEVSSFTESVKHPDGNWRYKFEKNPDGCWTTFTSDKDGSWALYNRQATGRPDIDLGKVTIAKDAKTGRVDFNATGSDSRTLGTFATIIDEGFMSETALKNKDPLSLKMVAAEGVTRVMEDPRFAEKEKIYSKDRLNEFLAEHEANSKLPQSNDKGIDPKKARSLAAAYRAVIAEFEAITKQFSQTNDTTSDSELAVYERESAHPLAVSMVRKDLFDRSAQETFSKIRLKDSMAKQNDPKAITGYKQLIADFDKISEGQKEVSKGAIIKYADNLRDNMVAMAIANTVVKDGKVTWPTEKLIQNLFSSLAPSLLSHSDNAKAVEEGITTHLKALGGSASDCSVRFGDNLVEHKRQVPIDQTAMVIPGANPIKDRVLEVLKGGKVIGKMTIATETASRE